MDASQLVAAIAAGEVKSVDAVLTFTERCYHIGCHQINAVTETFFEAAVAAARATVRAFPSPPDPRPATTSRRLRPGCCEGGRRRPGGSAHLAEGLLRPGGEPQHHRHHRADTLPRSPHRP